MPLKSYRALIGKDGLPTTFFQGRVVKLAGGHWFDTFKEMNSFLEGTPGRCKK